MCVFSEESIMLCLTCDKYVRDPALMARCCCFRWLSDASFEKAAFFKVRGSNL